MTSSHVAHITLLATTRGRREPVRRLLESLTRQTWRNFTLLLGDQNSETYLDELLAGYEKEFSIKRIPLEPQSLSKARNALLPHATGNIVALTDDDCYYAPDCLERAAMLFGKHDNMAALVGNANALAPAHPAEQRESRFSVFKNAPSWTLFFRADVMRATGTFDENLGVGSKGPYQSGEETDYLLRVFNTQRGKILRAASVQVFHDEVRPDDPGLPQKAYGYGLGRMYLLRKHNFPLWFKLANLGYPLARTLVEGRSTWAYRKAMFQGRLKGLLVRS